MSQEWAGAAFYCGRRFDQLRIRLRLKLSDSSDPPGEEGRRWTGNQLRFPPSLALALCLQEHLTSLCIGTLARRASFSVQ